MPRLEVLSDFHIQAVKGQEVETKVDDNGNEQSMAVEVWSIVLTDRRSGDALQIAFRRDTRDELVRQLTGGIVLAGGEIPKI